MKTPNVLWISTHDYPDLGCYSGIWPGAEYALTPNLYRLAAHGARFDLAVASAPVCAPAPFSKPESQGKHLRRNDQLPLDAANNNLQ
jgi:arylsulfatase A-like enzyme